MTRPSSTLVVAAHGLCMNDLQWSRAGHDHAQALARDLGGTAVYLRYNSGMHVSTNGRELAALLEALVDAWPVPVARIVVLGHSMGGLVARSAAHYGGLAGHRWRTVLESLVFLGTPHQGSPLERGGHGLNQLLDALPFATPLGRLGRVRSAGITDLRYGSVLDDDWQSRDRFAAGRRAPPAAAARRRRVPRPGRPGGPRDRREPGRDGAKTVAACAATAWCRSRARSVSTRPRLAPAIPASHRWIATSTGARPVVACRDDRLRDWLVRSSGDAGGTRFPPR
ncbi:MAG: hypothetical protein IPI87_04685 [Betaproteobacteria bacterium]|nr:hypothetical protein [Betaproteobacteria bacterium]